MIRASWGTGFAVWMAVCVVAADSSAQQTLNWTGAFDGIFFTTPGNWDGTPTGGVIDPIALIDNYIIDHSSATVLHADTSLILQGGTAAADLSISVLDGDLTITTATGISGDGISGQVEQLIIDGGSVTSQWVSAGLQVSLDSGSLTLVGGGNPINDAVIDFGGSLGGSLNFTAETPEQFLNEHLGKVTVNGTAAVDGVNLSVASDGGAGSIVTAMEAAFTLQINRATGGAVLSNDSGSALNFESMAITSAAGGLDAANWTSIAGNYDASAGGPIDNLDNWSITSQTSTELSETEGPPVVDGGSLADNTTLDLGQAWLPTPAVFEDAQIELTLFGGGTQLAAVEYTGAEIPFGSFDGDTDIDADDWAIFRTNLFSDAPAGASTAEAYLLGDLNDDGDIDHVDFRDFKELFDAQNGAGSFGAMVGVPEPGTLALVVFGIGSLCIYRRSYLPGWNGRKHMTRAGIIAAVATAVTLAVSGTTMATVVVQDLFDYPDGILEGNDGGIGWSGAWGATTGTGDPVGQFEIVSNQAIYMGGGASGLQQVITQSRPLTSAISLGSTDTLTIDFDLIIGAADTQVGRGIGVNFVDNTIGDILFTIGKRLNGAIAIWDNGIGGASTLLGTGGLLGGDTTPGEGVFSLTTTLTSNGADTFISLTDGLTTVDHTFAGEQFTLDTVALTGYHRLTTTNGIDDLVMDLTSVVVPQLSLEVNTGTGDVTLSNASGTPIDMDLYKIMSPTGSLDDVNWESIQSQGDVLGFPPGTGIGDGWEEAGGSDAFELGEAFLTDSSVLADGASIDLGSAFNEATGQQDVQLLYHDLNTGNFITVNADYIQGFLEADFNEDGSVDGDDFLVWQGGFGQFDGNATKMDGDANEDGFVDGDDFLVWQTQFGSANGSAATGVPEPTTLALLIALVAAIGCIRGLRQ